jgi:hypothetical protein
MKGTPDRNLTGMLEADSDLYERILDTSGFAFHFNEMARRALGNTEQAQREAVEAFREALHKSMKLTGPDPIGPLFGAGWNAAREAVKIAPWPLPKPEESEETKRRFNEIMEGQKPHSRKDD